jgi:O-antigen/teichoic acid export membrane protein
MALHIEIIGFLGFCIGFYFYKSTLDLYVLLILHSLYQFFKGIAFFLLFRNFISTNTTIDFTYFRKAFPFFLISVLGFLVSKADLYLIDFFTDDKTTAEYQVINSLLVFVISTSVFIYTPFTKNMYRNDAVMKKAMRFVGLSGFLVIPASLFIIHFILECYLKLRFPFWFYALCFLYIFPTFVYGIRVIELFKNNQEKKVILFLFASAIANLLVSAMLLHFHFGITGALIGGIVSQFTAWALFSMPIDKPDITQLNP